MDPQQQKHQNPNVDIKSTESNECENISTNNLVCRQSSTRWTPTTEQIRLLKELYYIKGLRSPTSDQIHTICAWLKRYGKVEGKNVFYWFQNHKARERQKKRPFSASNSNPVLWKRDQSLTMLNKHRGISFSSSKNSLGSLEYGAVAMENKVKELSISGDDLNGGNVNPNLELSPSNFVDKLSVSIDEDHEKPSEIETLPLFPMHNEEIHDQYHLELMHSGFCPIKGGPKGYYTGGYWWVHGGEGGGASLELSLNSYGFDCYSLN